MQETYPFSVVLTYQYYILSLNGDWNNQMK
jgi:hypothetical protein